MFEITDEIRDILDLGYALSTERYYFRLFDLVMNGCLKFTGADAGDLYIADNGSYRHLISINKTIGRNIGRGDEAEAAEAGEHIERNLVAYTGSQKKIINIADIYAEKQFEILPIKEFDAEHGYRTQSVLSIPMFEPGKNVIGVMQLINCKDDEGNTIPFPEEYESMVNSLCSQMAIALTNMGLIQQSEELLMSFVSAMTTAIDARTPYNANHTDHVTDYCMELIDYINALHTRGEFPEYINEGDREQLFMAAKLHDLGKMITPREVLNKSTRLGREGYDSLVNKLEKIRLMMKIDMLEGRMDSAEWAMDDLRLSNFIAELPELDIKEHLTEDDLQRIDFMSTKSYIDKDGIAIPYLNNDEIKALNIAKGTLTAEERKIVQQHVVYTDKMLAEINFSERYNKVRSIAANHHEYLNGSGYPNHLEAKDLDLLTRLLTIADIYDSLTSTDRPYKGPVPVKKALAILWGMAKEGKLDESLVRILCDYMLQRNAEEIAAEEEEAERLEEEQQAEAERLEQEKRCAERLEEEKKHAESIRLEQEKRQAL